MAGKKKGNRSWVWMAPENKSESSFRFISWRNKVNLTEKLRLRKFDPTTRKHIWFKESK